MQNKTTSWSFSLVLYRNIPAFRQPSTAEGTSGGCLLPNFRPFSGTGLAKVPDGWLRFHLTRSRILLCATTFNVMPKPHILYIGVHWFYGGTLSGTVWKRRWYRRECYEKVKDNRRKSPKRSIDSDTVFGCKYTLISIFHQTFFTFFCSNAEKTSVFAVLCVVFRPCRTYKDCGKA